MTGAADTDKNGEVLISELHNYAKAKVQADREQMRPYIQAFQEGFMIMGYLDLNFWCLK